MEYVSQHNELPPAYLSAIHQLGDCPARYIGVARKGRNIVYLAHPGAVIVQNDIVFKCTQKMGSAVLSWATTATRENGDALESGEIVNYEILVSSFDGTRAIEVPGTATEYTIDDLKPGDYQVTISTVLTDGLQSAWSEPVSVTIN